MAFPTLPPSWSAPTTCFESTDIFAVVYSREPRSNGTYYYWKWLFGVPATTPTGDCLPPSYVTSGPYFGQTCPLGYKNVFASRTTIYNQQAEATLCCPGTDYNFAVGPIGCQSTFDNRTFIATLTDPLLGTQIPASFSTYDGSTMNAFGVTVISTSSSSSTAPTTLPSSSRTVTTSPIVSSTIKPAGISAGVAAGIGIGVGLGVILLVLGGWIMYRRRRNKTPDGSVALNQVQYATAPKPIQSPAIPSPGNDPGRPNTYYQVQQPDFLPVPNATNIQGQFTSELPS
ncbi:hypothetical protein F5Y10DRAFT_291020 [Nemania abortiva]|nr:hypothetical protein F5Y10DRAFT_291020 [Nemania abortiva]